MTASCLVTIATLLYQRGIDSLGEKNSLTPLTSEGILLPLRKWKERTGQPVSQWHHVQEEEQGQRGKLCPPRNFWKSRLLRFALPYAHGFFHSHLCSLWVHLRRHVTVNVRESVARGQRVAHCSLFHVLIHPTKCLCSSPAHLLDHCKGKSSGT